MKKFITVALMMAFATTTVSSASSLSLSGTKNTATSSKTITMWHFNKDEGPNIVQAFNKKYPNIKVKLTIVPDKDMQFQNKLSAAIKSGVGVPDIVPLESSFVKKFINMNNAMYDISKDVKDITSDMYPYTLDVGKNNSGKLMAISHQAAPMVIGYKRSVAKKYLGTDDSNKISQMLSTSDKILATAKTLKSKSSGKVALFPTSEELIRFYLGARKTGWVKNNTLIIDNKMLEFMDLSKKLRSNKYESGYDQWSPGWAASIAYDDTSMCFGIPTWGVPWIIGSNDSEAKNGGRWGLAKPPYNSMWGGTWYSITKNCKNKPAALTFLRFFTSDKTHMKKWAKENQDFANSRSINKQLAANKSNISKITGMNNEKIFSEAAEKINGKLMTEYDMNIENYYWDAYKLYSNSKITKSEAIDYIKDQVREKYPKLKIY